MTHFGLLMKTHNILYPMVHWMRFYGIIEVEKPLTPCLKAFLKLKTSFRSFSSTVQDHNSSSEGSNFANYRNKLKITSINIFNEWWLGKYLIYRVNFFLAQFDLIIVVIGVCWKRSRRCFKRAKRVLCFDLLQIEFHFPVKECP